MTTFIDCDGTLIDYEDRLRSDVIAAARKHMEEGGPVVIWSGGGVGYAAHVARRCFPDLTSYVARSKNWRDLRDGDFVVDDMDFEVPPKTEGVVVMTPEAFVEKYG